MFQADNIYERLQTWPLCHFHQSKDTVYLGKPVGVAYLQFRPLYKMFSYLCSGDALCMEVDLCLYYAIKQNRFESKTFHTAIKK